MHILQTPIPHRHTAAAHFISKSFSNLCYSVVFADSFCCRHCDKEWRTIIKTLIFLFWHFLTLNFPLPNSQPQFLLICSWLRFPFLYHSQSFPLVFHYFWSKQFLLLVFAHQPLQSSIYNGHWNGRHTLRNRRRWCISNLSHAMLSFA